LGEFVNYQLKDSVAIVSMDDGKANVMSLQMQDELNAALDQADEDKAIPDKSAFAMSFRLR